jgi:Terminase large subunit, T4likevirus-type, N-terminal
MAIEWAFESEAHEKQRLILESPARLKAVNAARRFGKSEALLREAIAKCLGYKGKMRRGSNKVAMIVMPYLVQAKAVHWQPLLSLLRDAPFVDNINHSELRVKFVGDRPDLLLKGADNQGDRLRGQDIIWAGLDEYADFHPDVWDYALYPAMAANPDWSAMIIGTPKGKRNHFYEFCKKAYKKHDWQYFHFKTWDNPHVPREFIEEAEATLPPRVFQQEMEADWVNFAGAIFDEFKSSHSIAILPAEFADIFLGADWGQVHPYLAIVGVTQQGRYYVIDHWEPLVTPTVEDVLIREAVRLCQKWDVRRSFLPDDAPASILAFRQAGDRLGIPGLKRAVAVKRHEPGRMAGYAIMNSLFYQNRLYISQRLIGMKKDIESFHRAKDRNGLLLEETAPGQNNHSIDAVRHVVSTIEFRHGAGLSAAAA